MLPENKNRCTMDCFHCCLPDCINNSASLTSWEKDALNCAFPDSMNKRRNWQNRISKEYTGEYREEFFVHHQKQKKTDDIKIKDFTKSKKAIPK